MSQQGGVETASVACQIHRIEVLDSQEMGNDQGFCMSQCNNSRFLDNSLNTLPSTQKFRQPTSVF